MMPGSDVDVLHSGVECHVSYEIGIELFCREMTAAINEGKALKDAPAEEEVVAEEKTVEATEAPAEKTEEA